MAVHKEERQVVVSRVICHQSVHHVGLGVGIIEGWLRVDVLKPPASPFIGILFRSRCTLDHADPLQCSLAS